MTLELPIAWFIPHWIANNLASVVVTLTALWMVLMTGLLKEWIWEIKVVTWYLILASDTMIVEERLNDALNVISSKFSICFLILEEWEWKEKWSENKLTRQFPGLSSSLKKEKEGKNSLYLLSTLIRGDFTKFLFGCKVINRWVMTISFLWPIRTENVVDDMIGQKRWFS